MVSYSLVNLSKLTELNHLRVGRITTTKVSQALGKEPSVINLVIFYFLFLYVFLAPYQPRTCSDLS